MKTIKEKTTLTRIPITYLYRLDWIVESLYHNDRMIYTRKRKNRAEALKVIIDYYIKNTLIPNEQNEN